MTRGMIISGIVVLTAFLYLGADEEHAVVAVVFSIIGALLVVVGGLWICLSMAAREDRRWGDK